MNDSSLIPSAAAPPVRRVGGVRYLSLAALLVGLALTFALLGLAWLSAVRAEREAYATEVVRLGDAFATTLLTANNLLNDVVTLSAVMDQVGVDRFTHLLDDALATPAAVAAIAVVDYSTAPVPLSDSPETAAGGAPADAGSEGTNGTPRVRVLRARRTGGTRASDVRGQDGSPSRLFAPGQGVLSALERTLLAQPSMAPVPVDLGADAYFGLARLVPAPTAGDPAGHAVVIAVISVDEWLGEAAGAIGSRRAVMLSRSAFGLPAMRFERGSDVDPIGPAVLTVQGEVAHVLGAYGVELHAERDVGLGGLDLRLIATAAGLGLSITFLLVVLARTREYQAEALAERNEVIERQVADQTRELAKTRDAALRASQVKSEFLASMSHELRTPLNAIVGMAELLRDTPLSPEQRRYVSVFNNAGDALLALVDDILDFSRMEAGQVTLENVVYEPRHVVQQVLDMHLLNAEENQTHLSMHAGDDVPEFNRGDPVRLRQTLLNLLSNALKFTDRGSVTVTISCVGGEIEFAVKDTGIGIPDDKLESIFESFKQLDGSATRRYGGTGLGLSICSRLVGAMGGRITCESQVGEGSVFRVRLPIIEVDARDAAACRELRAIANKKLKPQRRAPKHPSEFDALRTIESTADESGKVETAAVAEKAPQSAVPSLEAGGTAGEYIASSAHELPPSNTALGRRAHAQDGDEDWSDARSDREILLVEDNEDNRLLIRSYLEHTPFRVDEATNGAQALSRCQRHRYRLVLMDIQMPVMDGYAATEAIRAFEKTVGAPRVPIIALTANAVDEDVERSLAAGCQAHLTKPIRRKTLINAIEHYLDSDDGSEGGDVTGRIDA